MPQQAQTTHDTVDGMPIVATNDGASPIDYLHSKVNLAFTEQSPPVRVTRSRIDHFTAASGDDQWFHVDAERAAKEIPGGKIVAHGFLVGALVATTERELMTGLTRLFPTAQLIELSFNFDLKGLVFVDDELTSTYRIVVHDSRTRVARFSISVEIFRVADEKRVATGSRMFMLRAR